MITANLIEFFCVFDEFCLFFELELKKRAVSMSSKRYRNRPGRMSDSEIMTILILFHTSRFRDLKSFYLGYICQHMRRDFPAVISYNRFVERQARVGLNLLLFLQTCGLGQCTGISIVDSTPLVSGHLKREHSHRTIRGWSVKEKCTMVWFFGFKLHLIINDKGEIIQWALTPDNCDDREPLKNRKFTEKNLWKAVCRQEIYLSGTLREALR